MPKKQHTSLRIFTLAIQNIKLSNDSGFFWVPSMSLFIHLNIETLRELYSRSEVRPKSRRCITRTAVTAGAPQASGGAGPLQFFASILTLVRRTPCNTHPGSDTRRRFYRLTRFGFFLKIINKLLTKKNLLERAVLRSSSSYGARKLTNVLILVWFCCGN